MEEAGAIRKLNVENFPAAYAFAAIPSRYALERSDWKGAAALELLPAELAWDKFPQAEAILVFARGLGAARSGDNAAARRDVQRLQALKEAMTAAKLDYWAGQADFQIKTIDAWLALAENREEEAVRLMRIAAEAEEASDKHPVTPGMSRPRANCWGKCCFSSIVPPRRLPSSSAPLSATPIASAALPARPARRKRQATARAPATIMQGFRRLRPIRQRACRTGSVQVLSREAMMPANPSPPSGTTRQAASPISRTRALRLPQRAVP